MKRNPSLIGAMKRVLTLAVALLATAVCSNAYDLKLWQGTYTTSTTWGAMEMIATGEASKQEARIRFTLDGRPADAEISQVKLTATTVSFLAMLAGRQYQFAGARRNNQWEGALAATGSLNDKGTWRLAHVDLRSAAANAEAPLPMPTGRYSIGRIAFHWVDETRLELETRAPDDRRQVLVYVFYPSEVKKTAVTATYIPDAEVMRDVWRDELTDRLKQVRAHSSEGMALARRPDRFPVVIFSPGNGQKALTYTTLLEDLASHGYVVAAIEPTYNVPAIRFPDGKVIRRPAPAERGWERPRNREEFVRVYQEQVVHWARDMSFALDRLTALDKGDGLFSHRLDLERVGAFGHSRGGQVAGTVRLLDPRFRGGINIDGNESGRSFQPISGGDGGKAPFMWIEDQFRQPTEQELRQAGLTGGQWKDILAEGDRLLQSVKGGSLRITIARVGSSHADFADNSFWDVSAAPEVRGGRLRTMAITRGYVLAFFDGCLRGRWGGLRKLVNEAGKAYPDVSARRFGALWPQ
jgi:predicted dienelactone hydrolase